MWDSAAFDGPDASDARTVTLEGADAGDYDVSAALGEGGTLSVPGRILPRQLVVTASATVARGTEGDPLALGALAALALLSGAGALALRRRALRAR